MKHLSPPLRICGFSVSLGFLFLIYLLPGNLQAKVNDASAYRINSSGFYENKGQITDQNYKPNPAVKYLLCSPGFNVQLRQTGFSYDTYTSTVDETPASKNRVVQKVIARLHKKQDRNYHRVDIELEGCNPNATIIADGKSEAYFNWVSMGVSEVHTYQHISYKNIYPHIDLEFFTGSKSGTEKGNVGVEYNFVVHPGGNPADIKLAYKGATALKLEGEQLTVTVAAGDFTEKIPTSYLRGNNQPVKVSYTALGNDVFAFALPKDLGALTTDLIIDPTPNLAWGIYYGNGATFGMGIALDANDNVYTTGYTGDATGIATSGAYQTVLRGGEDAYVAKLNAGGGSLAWASYYGGATGADGFPMTYSFCIAIDASNNVYIGGETESTAGIATTGAYKTSAPGGAGAFVAKFNANGTSLVWGTYYGGGDPFIDGDSLTMVQSIAVDASDNVYVTGETNCTTGISTAGSYEATFVGGGIADAFVAKFNAAGNALTWASYYGTERDAWTDAYSLALDAANNVYITGFTTSTTGIATAGSHQPAIAGGWDSFVARFNANGASLVWGTYYGGSGSEFLSDAGLGIALDASGNVYITGTTASATGIATSGAYHSTIVGYDDYDEDYYVAKFNASGTLLWGTYYGAAADDDEDGGWGIAVDASDNVYITGSTYSPYNIATSGAYEPVYIADTTQSLGEAFVAKINAGGASLAWGTYYGAGGGNYGDEGYAIAVDANGNVFVTGFTGSSSEISTPGAYQTSLADTNYTDAFVAEFGACTQATAAITGTTTSCSPVTLTASGGSIYEWSGGNSLNTSANTFTSSGTYTVTVSYGIGCSATASAAVTVNPIPAPGITGPATGCTPVTLIATGGTSYAWSGGSSPNTAANTFSSSGTYTVTVTNNCGTASTSQTVTINALPSSGITGTATGCGSVSLTATGGASYSWSGGSTPGTATNTFTTSGTYTVTVTNSCGTATASQAVTVNSVPVAGITGAVTGCSEVSLTATGGATYTWSGGSSVNAATDTFTNSGTYKVTVTGSANCTATASQAVTVNTAPTAGISGTATGCGSVVLAATGGANYAWSGGNSPNTALNAFATSGNYIVTVTNNNNCTATAQQVVTVDTIPVADINGTATGCGTVVLTATGGANYTWSGGNSPNTALNTFAIGGIYTVTATNSNNCTATASQSVTVNTIPTAGITGTPTGCGSVSLTATGGTGYAWSGGSSPNTAANTFASSNTYTVTVTGTGSCTATASQAITVNAITAAGITGTATGCGSVSLTATGGTGYVWSGGSSPSTAANTFSSSNTYTVTVTSTGSCTTTASQLVTVNAIPTASVTSGGATTFCAGDSVILTAGAANGYVWSNTATTQSITVKQTGSYTITVSSVNGCSATSTATTVTVNSLPNAVINGPTDICSGLQDTLTASGGTGYVWANGLGGNAQITVTPVTNTTYTVTVTNSNNCSATAMQTISVTSTPTASITGATQVCLGSSITLTANGGNTYTWANGLGSNAAITISPTQNTTYAVTAVIGTNCSATASQAVTVNAIPAAGITGTSAGCGSVSLMATGGTGYTWSGGSSPGTAANTFTSSNTYMVTVTGSSSCTATASQAVTVNTIPTAGITGTTTGCGSVSLTANGGIGYSWSGGSSPGMAANTFTSSNIYTVTVTGSSSCTATVQQAITVNTIPTAGITGTTAGCSSVSLTATGGTNYAWSGGSSPNTAANTFSSSNTYTVTVTGAGGCTATASQAVTVNALPTATITPQGLTTFCAGDTLALLSSSGSSYLWSTGATTEGISVSQSGSYTVRVTDNNGCTAISNAETITVNPSPATTITPHGSTTFCAGDNLTLLSSFGSFYLWSSGATTESIFITQPGSYTVLVTDNNGCTALSAPEVITVNSLPNALINGPTDICSGLEAILTASGGTIYTWSNDLGSSAQVTVSPVTNTTYTVTVTNSNSCTATASQTVSVTITPTASITGATQVCLGDSVMLTANGGNTYTWANRSGDASSITVSPAQNTTYIVTAIVGANCSATASQTVTVNQPGASQYSHSVCAGQSYSFDNHTLTQSGSYYDTLQTVNGCDSVVTLQLAVNSAIQTVITDTACQGHIVVFNGHNLTQQGVYTDTLQSRTGCDSVVTLSLYFNSSPIPTITQSNDTLQTQTYSSYQWLFNGMPVSNGSGQSLITIQNGNYRLVVTNANGCTDTSSAISVINVGIQNISSGYTVQLYPNPNNGNFTLQFSDNIPHTVSVVDVTGRLIIPTQQVAMHHDFHCSALASGVYLVCIKDDNGVNTLSMVVTR